MKNIKIIPILILFILLTGCGSTNNKILGVIELNKTTRDELNDLNLEMYTEKVFNEDKNAYTYDYIWDYADYTLNNVKGTIRIPFEDETHVAKFVNFSAEASSKNMKQLVDYLIDTYGKNYSEVEDNITRWTTNDLIIDYVLTEDNTVEVRWYTE